MEHVLNRTVIPEIVFGEARTIANAHQTYSKRVEDKKKSPTKLFEETGWITITFHAQIVYTTHLNAPCACAIDKEFQQKKKTQKKI